MALQAQTVKIWEGTPVHAGSTLTAYLPEGEPKAAVVVCPGGSYFWLDKRGEGELVGEWLAENGIAAYVLLYRTGAGSTSRSIPGPCSEATAIRT